MSAEAPPCLLLSRPFGLGCFWGIGKTCLRCATGSEYVQRPSIAQRHRLVRQVYRLHSTNGMKGRYRPRVTIRVELIAKFEANLGVTPRRVQIHLRDFLPHTYRNSTSSCPARMACFTWHTVIILQFLEVIPTILLLLYYVGHVHAPRLPGPGPKGILISSPSKTGFNKILKVMSGALGLVRTEWPIVIV